MAGRGFPPRSNPLGRFGTHLTILPVVVSSPQRPIENEMRSEEVSYDCPSICRLLKVYADVQGDIVHFALDSHNRVVHGTVAPKAVARVKDDEERGEGAQRPNIPQRQRPVRVHVILDPANLQYGVIAERILCGVQLP